MTQGRAPARSLVGLLAPTSLDAFLREHWGRRPLHVPGDSDRLGMLLDLEGFLDSLRGPDRDRDVQLNASAVTHTGRVSMIRGCPSTAVEALVETGWTVCADYSSKWPGSRFSDLRTLLRSIAEDLSAPRMGCSAYVSEPGHGFPLHWDLHHVLVLQLLGAKRWHHSSAPAMASTTCAGVALADGTVVSANAPIAETIRTPEGAPLRAPDLDELDETVLEAGDLFYLPPGYWHAPRATAFSLALSLSPTD